MNKLFPCTCWPTSPSSVPSKCTTASSIGNRTTLYQFYPAATVRPSRSHLREAVAADGRLLFLGDSLMIEIAGAAQCELKRAGLNPGKVAFARVDPATAKDRNLGLTVLRRELRAARPARRARGCRASARAAGAPPCAARVA